MSEQIPDTPLIDLGGGLTEAWACSIRTWSNYFAELASARGVDDLMRAQTRFMIDSFDVFGLAAGEMLQRHGLTTPTLNEP